MLYPKLLKQALLLTAVVGFATAARAQGYPASLSGPALTSQEKAKIAEITQEIQLEASQGIQDPQTQALAAKVARQVDTISNPHLASAREKILKFLGINPNSSDGLYIFVSWSMPLNELRAYEVDAMWSGATVVFRGVPPGVSLLDFITKDLSKLVWGKGASADISLDPRLFDAYQIQVVPTIVLTKTRKNFICAGVGKVTVDVKGKVASYSKCPAVAENEYIKISGAVTVDYALHQFENNGFPQAKPFLTALKRGYPPGTAATEAQKPFAGDWKSAYTPEKLMRQGPESQSAAQSSATH